MPSARELAEAALAATPEGIAEREERERALRERMTAEEHARRDATIMHEVAVTKIHRVLKINASGWKVLESTPDLVVFEDPEDGRIGGVKLSVTGDACDVDRVKVRYQPYSNWVGGEEGHTANRRLEWCGGPIVESLVHLGRLIREKDAYDQRISASMPDHLP